MEGLRDSVAFWKGFIREEAEVMGYSTYVSLGSFQVRICCRSNDLGYAP